MPDHNPVHRNPWQQLRQLTPARIALGRAGSSLPTAAQLDFQFAHAQARDAVHLPLDRALLGQQLDALGMPYLQLHSAAPDRHCYLQRPDLGRRLDDASAALLDAHSASRPDGYDLVICIADGLSARAIHSHSQPLLQRLLEHLHSEAWSLAPICLIEQGRVAIADDIGQHLKARMSVILIGERPGLSSPDSLGLYFTYGPRIGLTDAFRNCISNVRLEGLSYTTASFRLMYLMREACRRQLSGVELKDETETPSLNGPGQGNFLLQG